MDAVNELFKLATNLDQVGISIVLKWIFLIVVVIFFILPMSFLTKDMFKHSKTAFIIIFSLGVATLYLSGLLTSPTTNNYKSESQKYEKQCSEIIQQYPNVIKFNDNNKRVVIFTKEKLSKKQIQEYSCGKDFKLKNNQVIVQYDPVDYDYKVLTTYQLKAYQKLNNEKTSSWINEFTKGLKPL